MIFRGLICSVGGTTTGGHYDVAYHLVLYPLCFFCFIINLVRFFLLYTRMFGHYAALWRLFGGFLFGDFFSESLSAS